MGVYEHLQRQDWTGLKAAVAAAGPNEAYRLIADAGEQTPIDSPLDGLVGGADDVLGLTISGGLRFRRAARIRGGLVAAATPEERMRRYADELFAAVDDLNAALAADPACGLAAAFLAGAAVEGDADDRRAIEATLLAARDVPDAAWAGLLRASTAKWGGSEDEMWAVARRHSGRTPGALALTPMAHFEQFLHFAMFDDAPDARDKARGYFQRPEVRHDLAETSDRALAAPADADPHSLRTVDGWMARTLLQAGDRRRARAHLKRLGRHADPGVWCLGTLGGSADAHLGRARRRAGLWFG